MGCIPKNVASSVHEALGVYDLAKPQAVDEFCDQLDAFPNQREIIRKYSESLNELAQELGRQIKKGFGLHGDLFRGWPCHLRLQKYDNTTETLGLTAGHMHSDQSFLSILMDDEMVSGLEIVEHQTGEFIPIPPMPGNFLVNTGDIAKVWRNGRFCNVKHRVQSNEPKVSISVAYFILGPRDEKVETPSKLRQNISTLRPFLL